MNAYCDRVVRYLFRFIITLNYRSKLCPIFIWYRLVRRLYSLIVQCLLRVQPWPPYDLDLTVRLSMRLIHRVRWKWKKVIRLKSINSRPVEWWRKFTDRYLRFKQFYFRSTNYFVWRYVIWSVFGRNMLCFENELFTFCL